MTTPRRIRVVIAEDSEAMRTTLETLLGADPRLEVIGSAKDGREAVALAKTLRPDVITMDVVMPYVDGVEATSFIMAEAPCRILMVSSYVDNRQVDLAFRAIAAGALEVVAKPTNSRPEDLRVWARRVCDAITLMAEVPVITRHRRTKLTTGRLADAIGLVASTGGPPALAQILGALPPELPIPLLIAQHITEGFTGGLVRWLSNVSRLKISVAVDGAAPRPGHVYLSPDGLDLEIGSGGLMHTPRACESYAPSGDRLLTSLARYYQRRSAGIVLTGMGDDGALGLLAIRDAGGFTLAQSQQSCIVFGMPQACLMNGATADLRPIETLISEIIDLSGYPMKRSS